LQNVNCYTLIVFCRAVFISVEIRNAVRRRQTDDVIIANPVGGISVFILCSKNKKQCRHSDNRAGFNHV
jgi:hypothetical protein